VERRLPQICRELRQARLRLIEIAAHHLNNYSPPYRRDRRSARANASHHRGPRAVGEQEPVLAGPEIRKAGRAFFEETLTNLAKLDARVIGGRCTPTGRSIIPSRSIRPATARAASKASPASPISPPISGSISVWRCSIDSRTRAEYGARGVAFVREVGKPNVKVHLDTFHMNIEENSFAEASAPRPAARHFHTARTTAAYPARVCCPGTRSAARCARSATTAPSSWSRSSGWADRSAPTSRSARPQQQRRRGAA